jgi:surfeit locus 1 family protein
VSVFRSGPWAISIVLAALCVLLGLGIWQLQRHSWKTALVELRETRLAEPPIALPADLGDAAALLAAMAHRRITVSGEFLHDREVYLAATRRGAFGFRVITPLRRVDGAAVLVDRGWVPNKARDPAFRLEGQIEGPVTVRGLLRGASERGRFAPDNDPANNYWFWRELAAMATFAGVDAPPILIEADTTPNPGGLPIGRKMEVNLRNEHLQYAIVWFSLALTLVVIAVLARRRAIEDAA